MFLSDNGDFPIWKWGIFLPILRIFYWQNTACMWDELEEADKDDPDEVIELAEKAAEKLGVEIYSRFWQHITIASYCRVVSQNALHFSFQILIGIL